MNTWKDILKDWAGLLAIVAVVLFVVFCPDCGGVR